MVQKGKPRGRKGRPRAGVQPGEKASEYRRLMLRLPEDTLAELQATARAVGRPQWRVVVDALKGYTGAGPVLSEATRRLVRDILKADRQGESDA